MPKLARSVLVRLLDMSTDDHVRILKAAGLDTEAADVALGFLAGNAPDAYRAVVARLWPAHLYPAGVAA